MIEELPRVYVTQFMQSWDFSDVPSFGEAVFLTEKEYRPEPAPTGYNARITEEILEAMKSYRPGVDFILLTGSAMPNFVAGQILSKSPGVATNKVLKWNGRTKNYQLFKV